MKNLLVILLLGTLALTGCGGGGSNSTPTVSPTQQAVADNSDDTAFLSSMVANCGVSFTTGNTAGLLGVLGAPGISPTNNVTTNGTVTHTTIDFGTVLTNVTVTLAGLVTVNFDSATNSGTIQFTNFTDTRNGRTVVWNGTITFTKVTGANTVTANDNLTITINGQALTLVGDLTANYGINGITEVTEVTTAHQTLTSAQGTFTATITNLTFDATTHRPNGGTIAATYQATGSSIITSVLVTFNSASPATGVVLVSLDGGAALPTKISAAAF